MTSSANSYDWVPVGKSNLQFQDKANSDYISLMNDSVNEQAAWD
jgi:hypothetical protein